MARELAAAAVGASAPVVERHDARGAERDVGLPQAPRAAERVGHDHAGPHAASGRDAGAKRRAPSGPDPRAAARTLVRLGGVRLVHAGVGAHQAVTRLADQHPVARRAPPARSRRARPGPGADPCRAPRRVAGLVARLDRRQRAHAALGLGHDLVRHHQQVVVGEALGRRLGEERREVVAGPHLAQVRRAPRGRERRSGLSSHRRADGLAAPGCHRTLPPRAIELPESAAGHRGLPAAVLERLGELGEVLGGVDVEHEREDRLDPVRDTRRPRQLPGGARGCPGPKLGAIAVGGREQQGVGARCRGGRARSSTAVPSAAARDSIPSTSAGSSSGVSPGTSSTRSNPVRHRVADADAGGGDCAGLPGVVQEADAGAASADSATRVGGDHRDRLDALARGAARRARRRTSPARAPAAPRPRADSDSRCLAAPKLLMGRIAMVRIGGAPTVAVHVARREKSLGRARPQTPGSSWPPAAGPRACPSACRSRATARPRPARRPRSRRAGPRRRPPGPPHRARSRRARRTGASGP